MMGDGGWGNKYRYGYGYLAFCSHLTLEVRGDGILGGGGGGKRILRPLGETERGGGGDREQMREYGIPIPIIPIHAFTRPSLYLSEIIYPITMYVSLPSNAYKHEYRYQYQSKFV